MSDVYVVVRYQSVAISDASHRTLHAYAFLSALWQLIQRWRRRLRPLDRQSTRIVSLVHPMVKFLISAIVIRVGIKAHSLCSLTIVLHDLHICSEEILGARWPGLGSPGIARAGTGR